ncbi:MAG: CPBP family intramembrane metalloprotease [Polyangiaceae bacterium]|nr:CPBP family intramembrane metalloprotease [Polyangiaceae bacterium]
MGTKRRLAPPKLKLPDGPRWSKPRYNWAALRAALLYGTMSAVAVGIALALRDGPAWEHPAPWLVLRMPTALGLSAALGLTLAAAAIAATRIVTSRFAWGRRLHRDLRPMARHLSLTHILLLAGFSSLGEELLFRGLLTPAIGVPMSAVLFGLAHQIAGPSRWVWVTWASVMGVGFGAIFATTGSLLGPLLAHAVMNAVNLAYLRDHEPADDETASPAH